MENQKANSTINWVAFNSELLTFLKTKDNHRFSRYDAFIWLVEHIKEGHVIFDSKGLRTKRTEYVASYTRLADAWHWSRPTVQKFIEELDSIAVIKRRKNCNAFIFTLNMSTDNRIVM